MSPGMRAANAALMNLASLDDLVRGFQHLALAIREHCTKAAPGETAESSSTSFKKCQLLLRAALNGCKRAKVAVDRALLSGDLSTTGLAFDAATRTNGADEGVSNGADEGDNEDDSDDEAEELTSTLTMLQGQFQRYGDILYMGPDIRCQHDYAGAASKSRDSISSSNSNSNNNKSSSSRNGSGSNLGDRHTGNRDSGYFLGMAGNAARSRMHAADVAALWHRHCMEQSSSSCHSRKILGGSHPSNYSSRDSNGSNGSSLGHGGSCTSKSRNSYERHSTAELEPCRLAEALARGLLSSSARALAARPNGHTSFSWMGRAATRDGCSNWNAGNIVGSNASLRPSSLVPPGHTAFSWGCTRSSRGSFDGSSDRRDSSSFRHCGVNGECTPDLDMRSSESRLSSWARLLSLIVRVRDLESSVPFRRKLLKAQNITASFLQHTPMQMAASALTGCEQETFAFGSTPFTTWARLFDPRTAHTPQQLRDALQRCTTTSTTTPPATATNSTTTSSTQGSQSSPPPSLLPSRYVVFGSSIGLLAFYGAHGLGLRTTGYEILPFLAHASVDVARSIGCTDGRLRCTQECDTCSNNSSDLFEPTSPDVSSGVAATEKLPSDIDGSGRNGSNGTKSTTQTAQLEIVCGDMLGADLSNAAIVLLTSQCWDAPLAHRVHVKLATELPAGAVVVDYTNALGEFDGSTCGWHFLPCSKRDASSRSGDGASNGRIIGEDEDAAVLVAPVSWNPTQRFYVYHKVQCSGTLP